jgi:hypothetical protein
MVEVSELMVEASELVHRTARTALLGREFRRSLHSLPRIGGSQAAPPDGRAWLRPLNHGDFALPPVACISLVFGWASAEFVLLILVCVIRWYA